MLPSRMTSVVGLGGTFVFFWVGGGVCCFFLKKNFSSFSYFLHKTGFYISCQLSPMEICMKCQNLFLGKIGKNNFSMSPAKSFTQSAKHQIEFVELYFRDRIIDTNVLFQGLITSTENDKIESDLAILSALSKLKEEDVIPYCAKQLVTLGEEKQLTFIQRNLLEVAYVKLGK